MTIFENYHKTREVLDPTFIKAEFTRQERSILADAQRKYPNSKIRMANADLIAAGCIKGIGGSIPANWDGTIKQL